MTATTDPIELTQALIRRPSVNPDYDAGSHGEGAVANWIADWGRAGGFAVSRHPVLPGRDNVVLQFRNGADAPHLMFNGHMDTVGVAGMSLEPFGGEVRAGRVWGRGASDMKGPLGCMLAAAARLKCSPENWRGTVSVACVVDEEFQFRGVSALLEHGPRPDFAIVGEPTELRVVRGCKGCLRFTIHAVGRAAHSSKPWEGRSAIVAMAAAVLELERHFAEGLGSIQREGFGSSTGSVGLIRGGTGINIVPEQCAIQVDVRLLPGQDWRETYAGIQEVVRTRATAVAGIEWGFDEPSVVDPSFELPAEHWLVRTACAALGRAEGEIVFFSCDASKLAARGVPVLVIGPGSIAQAHTVDEFIAVADLEAGADAYERLGRTLLAV